MRAHDAPRRCEIHAVVDCTHPACIDLPPPSSTPPRPRLVHPVREDDATSTRDRVHAANRYISVRTAREIIDAPAPEEIVEGVLWADAVTVLVGESGAGKTFVALDLAAAITEGVDWHGRHVLPGSVIYVVFEGSLKFRLTALERIVGRRLEHFVEFGADLPISPRITRDGEEMSLGERVLRDHLAAARDMLADRGAPPIRLLVIDTVRASLVGSEDSSEHVAAYLRAVQRVLSDVPGAAALLLHHSGWLDGESPRKRERGSSAWRGNVDATLYLETAGEYDRVLGERRLTLRALKIREGELPPPLSLIRQTVETGDVDRYGRPITSCIIRRDDRPPSETHATARAGDDRDLDLRVLEIIRDYPQAATSRVNIRAIVGLSTSRVDGAIGRLLQAGWITAPERQRQPYQPTAAGLAALRAAGRQVVRSGAGVARAAGRARAIGDTARVAPSRTQSH
jgi:KaiC/GvpD/RAD55 family RecA-like ATPase